MRERRDQILRQQFDKLSNDVIWSSRVVRSQFLYLSKHFLMGDVTETEGGMRVICKTIDQPIDVLVRSLSTGDEAVTRSAVEAKYLLRSLGSARSGCWLG